MNMMMMIATIFFRCDSPSKSHPVLEASFEECPQFFSIQHIILQTSSKTIYNIEIYTYKIGKGNFSNDKTLSSIHKRNNNFNINLAPGYIHPQ